MVRFTTIKSDYNQRNPTDQKNADAKPKQFAIGSLFHTDTGLFILVPVFTQNLITA
jgi:hypothetical protein